MHRFYNPKLKTDTDLILLTNKEEILHLRNVLRLKKGDTIQVFDGESIEVTGTILSVLKNEVLIKSTSVVKSKKKQTNFILACAIPKRSKFETIIEKATELGVDEIIPLKTKRTEIHLTEENSRRKASRYDSVGINASKQSGRIIIPKIHPTTKFEDTLENLTSLGKNNYVVIPSLLGKRQTLFKTLKSLKKPKSISLLIGPEGDFTEEEYSLAHSKGCLPVTLGDTILKVETAALCALSCCKIFFEEKRKA